MHKKKQSVHKIPNANTSRPVAESSVVRRFVSKTKHVSILRSVASNRPSVVCHVATKNFLALQFFVVLILHSPSKRYCTQKNAKCTQKNANGELVGSRRFFTQNHVGLLSLSGETKKSFDHGIFLYTGLGLRIFNPNPRFEKTLVRNHRSSAVNKFAVALLWIALLFHFQLVQKQDVNYSFLWRRCLLYWRRQWNRGCGIHWWR